MQGEEYKGITSSGRRYKLILKVKSTGDPAIFGGYQLGTKGSSVIVDTLDPQTLLPTGGSRVVSPGDLEILDPQPYND